MAAQTTKVILARALHARLMTEAKAKPDIEICGLLIGRDDSGLVVDDVVFVPNVAGQPRTRFEIDPQMQFELLRKLRGTTQRIVGHVHSHPSGAAVPSSHDLAMAHDPDAIWVIVGLAPKTEVQAYIRLRQDQGFQPVMIDLC